MKVSKIIAVAATASMIMGSAFAEEFAFENEVSSDIVSVEKNGDETENAFAGITEKVSAEYKSEKVDFKLEVEFDLAETDDERKDLFLGKEGAGVSLDGYLEFRPVEMVTLGFHDYIFVDGGNLPIFDEDIPGADIGSNGFTVCLRPIEGLRLTSSVPMPAVFGDKLPLNFGVAYAYGDMFTAAAGVQNCLNDEIRSMGVFGTFNLGSVVDGFDMNLGLGFSMYENLDAAMESLSGDLPIAAKKLLTAVVEWNNDAFEIAAEYAGDFGAEKDDAEYDQYAALSVGVGINDMISVSLAGSVRADTSDAAADPLFGINPAVDFTFGNNTVSVGLDMAFSKETTGICFPVKWTYSF